jgi:proliferating cell nuclear antigen
MDYQLENDTDNEYALKFKTVQSTPFRVLIEALKDILTEANFVFEKDGMKITAMDPSHTVLVHLKLKAENFEAYYCPKKLVLGIYMLNFYKLIKTMSNNDTLTLFVLKSELNSLGIKIENSEKNQKTTYTLDLMDIDEESINIPPAEFNAVITMLSSDFQKICRDMNNLAEKIEIKSAGKQLIFSCKGDFASQETIMGESSNNGMNYVQNEQDAIIQGEFALKHLVLFTKCTNLCNSIKLYLKNNFPIIISYTVANLGDIKLCLAPQTK